MNLFLSFSFFFPSFFLAYFDTNIMHSAIQARTASVTRLLYTDASPNRITRPLHFRFHVSIMDASLARQRTDVAQGRFLFSPHGTVKSAFRSFPRGPTFTHCVSSSHQRPGFREEE